MRLSIILVAAVGLAAATGFAAPRTAAAGPLSASAILAGFNAVIYGNATTSADIEGGSVIGGNFSGATLYNHPVATQPPGYGALTVYGSTSGNDININNGGSAYVGGTRGARLNFNGGGSYFSSAPSQSIGDFRSTLNSLSQSLAGLAATAPLPTPGNNEVFNATPGANGIAVFSLTAADLAVISSFSVNLNGASTVVFNVSGANPTFSANDNSGANGANNIIWNFFNAVGTVAINTLIGGTVLATGATVTNQNQIDGVLVANGFNGHGEVHDYAFAGTLPGTPVSVPEPQSLALLAVGAACVGLLRRRR